jgi:hypothetical protein
MMLIVRSFHSYRIFLPMPARFSVACLFLCGIFASQGAEAALTIQGFNPNRHERFGGNAFFASGVDFSGVASSGLNAQNQLSFSGWATMITPSYFLSATHFHPSTGVKLNFYETNSLTGNVYTGTVASGQAIGNSDLWLGRLDQPVSANVAKYSILTGDYTGGFIDVVGRSTADPEQRVGSNNIDEYINGFSDPNLGSTVSDVYLFDYDNPGGTGIDEAYVQGGDSGAPSFAVINGKLVLTGIHWFQYTADDGSLGSGDTRAGNYMNALNAAIIGESATFVSVPEPSSLLVMLGIAGGYVRFRRREQCA